LSEWIFLQFVYQYLLMQYFSDFFTFLDQCCDAEFYLRYGLDCANTGNCYDDVRPMGAVYWFSLPFRLGLPPATTLIAAHLLLTALSVVLSVLAMRGFLSALPVRRYQTGLFFIFLGSLLSHTVFLYPFLRVSLSDSPASLLFLIGIWLLLLSSPAKWSGFVMLVLAGFCLGLAAWMRSFFLYPVIVVVILGLLFGLYYRKFVVSGLLLAILPVGIQFHATWNLSGQLSYINPNASQAWTSSHLNSEAIGYDTLVPAKGYYWFSTCEKHSSLAQSIIDADIQSLGCLFAGRLNFYLGSYSIFAYPPVEFSNPQWGANLLPTYRESANSKDVWASVNMQRTENAGLAPDKTQTAYRLSKPDNSAYGEISQTIMLQSDTNPYEFATWIWSAADPHMISMNVRYHDSKKIVSEKNFLLPSKMDIQVLKDVFITQTGYYDLVISSPGMQSKDIFLWQDLDLRQFILPEKPLIKESIRLWSKWILALNSLACFGAILFTILLRKKINFVQSLAPLIILLAGSMALLVIPEQRFVIAPLIAIWILFITVAVTLCVGKRYAIPE
jgi:hypothetical protein